ncbi:Transposase, IS4 family protein [Synechococcus sp. PCC 7335]|uniref:transposase n=1 Tax=Synechococcus sp. (strain ATCC 29403 / PCC 7335) TaxID=91464 RepID=UPI00017EB1BD|nr:transposase [Synechococcus sp. PCC 7335]EDX83547.1 Transposase, IS4 family protein [Synechococcus sp. PCC 7335]
MLQHAQRLVYSLISLMPSHYQEASLKALFARFLPEQGHALPEHTPLKSPSSLSRFLNRYSWSTRQIIRTTRAAVLDQLAVHPVGPNVPVRLLIDLTTLRKTGKFWHLSTPTEDVDAPEPWVRMLNGKRGLHLVVLYLVIGERRIPWSFRIWHGKGEASPSQLACKLLATVPRRLIQGRTVIVQGDTEFGTVAFFNAVRRRRWRAVVGVRNNRLLQDGRRLKDLPRCAKRGLQVRLKDIDYPLTISWFWLKRADDKRELRFVASTYPYTGIYLIRLGRKRWAIEGFFKTVKHQFGLHCFGQGTKLGVYRWLILSFIAYVLAHWIDLWACPPALNWKATSRLTIEKLLPSVLLLKHIRRDAGMPAQYGFEIVLKSLPSSA